MEFGNRILGIDYGERRLGIAISDDTNTIATPLDHITNNHEVFDTVKSIITKYNVRTIVVGLPINLDGSHSKSAKIVNNFCKQIKKKLNITVHMIDERLSSIEAENKLRESGKTPSRYRSLDRGIIDSAAAAIILESFINKEREQIT
tara:strand:+ start:1096 stop:1536 length:441 start_codon:yes stop_codon:yes gene_type:complete